MEKYELPKPPKRMPGNSSSKGNPFDRTYLRPLFLKVRCPSCEKIYRIDSRDAEKSIPEFECLGCQVIFTFDTPVLDPVNIVTRVIGPGGEKSAKKKKHPAGAESVDTSATATTSAEKSNDMSFQDARKCPKCFALNPKAVTECLKCGVIFARLDGLPMDPGTGAIPSLVKAWQDLMGDYQNLRKHFEFVDRCEDLRAIPYALKKYEDLKAVQPQDEIAKSMLHKVIMRQFRKLTTEKTDFVKKLSEVPWRRVSKVGPLCVAGLMMLLGVGFPYLRNLVGIGAALAFVTVGFVVFVKGRFSPKDFWED